LLYKFIFDINFSLAVSLEGIRQSAGMNSSVNRVKNVAQAMKTAVLYEVAAPDNETTYFFDGIWSNRHKNSVDRKADKET
jgi:hypothetical protein